MLRSFLIMTALITPTSYLWAEDIQLRCDPVSGSSDPLMVRVMPSAPEVFVKQGEVARTYIPRTYQKNDKDSPGYGWTICKYTETDYARIDDDKIDFGTTSQNVNTCGERYYLIAPGTLHDIENRKYSIDRDTGVLTENSVYNIVVRRYQCAVWARKAIP
jgi:hypothetical protein